MNVHQNASYLAEERNNSACATEIPNVKILLTDVSASETVVLCIGTIAAITIIVLYACEIRRKCNSNLSSTHRRNLLSVLILFPVYAMSHGISIWSPNTVDTSELLCMLFFVISMLRFMELVTNYFGGAEFMFKAVKDVKFSMAVRPCCCCIKCCPTSILTRRAFMTMNLCIVQYILISTLLLYLNVILGPIMPVASYQVYVSLLRLISTLAAVYSLRLFLSPTAICLPQHKLVRKFSCIQLSLVLTNLGRVILQLLAEQNVIQCNSKWSAVHLADWYHSASLLVGICLLSILAWFSFDDNENFFPLQSITLETTARGYQAAAAENGTQAVESTQVLYQNYNSAEM